MHQASVGFHCPNCATKGRQKVYTGPAAFGGTFTPVVSYGLIAVNVLVFFFTIARGESRVLFDFGAFGPFISEEGEWYRIVTSAFLHWGLVHLMFNMYALWNIGPAVERALGRAGFGLVYGAALMGGSAGALLVKPDAVTAGASGAIFGLLGALVVLYRRAGIDIVRSGLGLTLGLNLLITLTIPQISIGGHLGGFAGGLLVAWLLVNGPQVLRSRTTGLVLAVLAIPAFAVIALYAASTWTNPLFG
jgi:membrane associated rhomboid family serine protease